MRRLLLVILAGLLALTLVACGDDSSHSVGDTRKEALSFLPRDALLTAVVQTDEDADQVKGALDLVRGFPGGTIALGQLEDRISQAGPNYRDDVKPLLGHPAALAVLGGRRFVFALVASDEDALGRAIQGMKPTKRGTHAGFDRYATDDGTAVGRDGPTVVVADGMATLDAALDRHRRDTGLTEAAFDGARGDLPDDALVTGTGGFKSLIGGPGVDDSGLPWLDAARGFAFTVTTDKSGVAFDARVDTSGSELSDGDLPLATGDEAPKVAAAGNRVTLGIRDLAKVETFLESAARATAPADYHALRSAEDDIRASTGVDLSGDVAGELSGDTTVSVDPRRGTVALRSGVHDPVAMGDALERIQSLLPAFLESLGVPNATVTSVGDNLWVVQQDGRSVGGFGVVGDDFVAGNAQPEALGKLAQRPTKADPGAKGAVSIRVPKREVRALVSDVVALPPAIGGLVTGRLGDLHGWIASAPDGLRISLRQDVG